MNGIIQRLVLGLVLTACSAYPLQGQRRIPPKETKKEHVSPLIPGHPLRETEGSSQDKIQKAILRELQTAILRGDGALFARHLGPQVYINLRGSEGGYYSANQAHYILQNFFSTHRPVTFNFSTYGEIEANPFATGRGLFNARGVRESLQVYVSLVMHEGRWVIAEFNAY